MQPPLTASQVAAPEEDSVATNARPSQGTIIPKPGTIRGAPLTQVSIPIPRPSVSPSHVPPIIRETPVVNPTSREPKNTPAAASQRNSEVIRQIAVPVERPSPAPSPVPGPAAESDDQRAAKRRRISTANEDAIAEAAETRTPGQDSCVDTEADAPSSSAMVGPEPPSQIYSQPIRQSIESAQPAKIKKPRISKQAKAKKRALRDEAASIVADAIGERPRKRKKTTKVHSQKQAETMGTQQVLEEPAVEESGGPMKKRKPKKKYKKRESTPEGAEDIQIVPDQVTMSELTGNVRTGRRSSRDKELQILQEAEKDKKKLARKKAREGNTEEPAPGNEEPVETAEERLERLAQERRRSASLERAAPRTVIIDGQIQLDEASLVIDRHARAARDREVDVVDFIEESELTRRVNSNSWLKVDRSGGWNEALTEQFYEGLRMFGTDFHMISKMFPGRTRHAVKLKFNKEEKFNAWRIESTLKGEKLAVDMDEYSKLTNTVFSDPKDLDREMADDKKKIEEEEAQAKAAMEEAEKERADHAAREAAENREEDSAEESEGNGEKTDYVTMKMKRRMAKKKGKENYTKRKSAPGASSGGVTS